MNAVLAILAFLAVLGWVCSRSPGRSIFEKKPRD